MCEKKWWFWCLSWLSGSISPTSASTSLCRLLLIGAVLSPGNHLPFLHSQRSEKKPQHWKTSKCGINKNFFPLPLPIALCSSMAAWKGSSLEDRLFLYCLCSSSLRSKGGIRPVEWEPECTWLNVAKAADFTRSCNFSKDICRGT